MSGLGDNSVAADQLRLLIERIERLSEERQGISDDIKDVYLEGKATGFDAKTMRKLVALRKIRPDVRMESQMLLETYASAIGLDLV